MIQATKPGSMLTNRSCLVGKNLFKVSKLTLEHIRTSSNESCCNHLLLNLNRFFQQIVSLLYGRYICSYEKPKNSSVKRLRVFIERFPHWRGYLFDRRRSISWSVYSKNLQEVKEKYSHQRINTCVRGCLF